MRAAPIRLLALVALTTLWALPAAAQVIQVTPSSVNFGQMGQREIRDTQITVTNIGAGRLVISDLEADCGCTVPSLGKEELAPGESTVLEIQFDSKLFVGPVLKHVTIHTNDPTHPVTEIVLSAQISAPLILRPARRRVGFPDAPSGRIQERAVTFMASDVPELKITVDGTAKGLFQVNTVNGIDGNPQHSKLEVRVPVDMPWGLQRDNVRVMTNVPEMPTVDLELSVRTIAILRINPEKINMRFKKKSKETIRLTPREGKEMPFTVTGAEIDLPDCTVTVDVRQPNVEVLVVLTGTPLAKDHPMAVENGGRIKGTLTITTDVENLETIEIPITYMVRM